MPPRIALIHAYAHAVAPLNAAFAQWWPQAQLMNVLDDSLSVDLQATAGGADQAMYQRFERLADYALSTGADGLVFTCSAFGPCIDAVIQKNPGRVILKPNQALLQTAVSQPQPMGLLASFEPTLKTMAAEFSPTVTLHTALAHGALQALEAGDLMAHDLAVVQAAQNLAAQGCQCIALAQISLARAAPAVHQATGLPVLTTLDSTVHLLRRSLSA
jgi:aspartate/glutamate racemase